MFVVALTGDVGSGKSTVARTWGEQGASVIDSDTIAREQWLRQDVLNEAVTRWGKTILDSTGKVNLLVLRDLVFASKEDYEFACALIHPHTRKETERRLAKLRGWVVFEIPLLYETGRPQWVDYVVYVESSPSFKQTQAHLRGWQDGDLERRERFMLPSEQKKKQADAIYTNDADLTQWVARAAEQGMLFKRMASVAMVETTCANAEEATSIAHALLEKRLIACANTFPCNSFFRWNGVIQSDEECLFQAKTLEEHIPEVMSLVREHHSYELPAIEVKEIVRGDVATLRWISDSCK